jgi:hypothetical protein
MALEHVGRDIYMRHTDKDGNCYVQEHRAWDADLFITSQMEAALKVGGKSLVQQITKDQYLKERAAKK